MIWKPPFFLLLIFFLTGCLVPGAPQTFNYHTNNSSKCATLEAISFPHQIEYFYQPCEQLLDSVFLFEPKLKAFKKVSWNETEECFRLTKRENMINGNLSRMRKIDAIVIKKYKQNVLSLDTLSVYEKNKL